MCRPWARHRRDHRDYPDARIAQVIRTMQIFFAAAASEAGKGLWQVERNGEPVADSSGHANWQRRRERGDRIGGRRNEATIRMPSHILAYPDGALPLAASIRQRNAEPAAWGGEGSRGERGKQGTD